MEINRKRKEQTVNLFPIRQRKTMHACWGSPNVFPEFYISFSPLAHLGLQSGVKTGKKLLMHFGTRRLWNPFQEQKRKSQPEISIRSDRIKIHVVPTVFWWLIGFHQVAEGGGTGWETNVSSGCRISTLTTWKWGRGSMLGLMGRAEAAAEGETEKKHGRPSLQLCKPGPCKLCYYSWE